MYMYICIYVYIYMYIKISIIIINISWTTSLCIKFHFNVLHSKTKCCREKSNNGRN